MEITATITQVLPEQTFTSRRDGQPMKKYAFVATTQEQYPKTICFTCFGQDKWAQMNIIIGKAYNIHFDLSSREYNGRWYTEATAWKTTSLEENANNNTQAPQPQQPQAVQTPQAPQAPQAPQPQNANDDLPF